MPKKTGLKFVLLFLSIFALSGQLAQARLGDPNSYVPALVDAAFQHAPEMIEIARCESGIRQYNSDGSVLRGGAGKKYVGIFQIDPNIHTTAASGMGFDINTAEGNIGYAKYMHSRSGTRPWAGCVKGDTSAPVQQPATPTLSPSPAPTPTPNPAAVPPVPMAPGEPVSASGALTANLNLGMTHPQVMVLQKFLNANGYVIAASGPGSPGNETSFFGGLTREALRKFQCARQIACDGNESTTGYGRLGPMTRAAILK